MATIILVNAIILANASCSGPGLSVPWRGTDTPTPTDAPTPTRAPTATRLPEGSHAVGVPVPGNAGCLPTPDEGSGPNYEPHAPVRSSVGRGYTLTGRVVIEGTCRPLPHALVELWLAGPEGRYESDYRATVRADAKGRFTFTSHRPPSYGDGSPHIHVRASARDARPVFLVHYPQAGTVEGSMAIVLAADE